MSKKGPDVNRDEIIEDFKHALHLDNFDYSLGNVKKTLDKYRTSYIDENQTLDFCQEKSFSLEEAYKTLELDLMTDNGIGSQSKYRSDGTFLDYQILCFRTGLCMLIEKYAKQNNNDIFNYDDDMERRLINDLRQPYETCSEIIQQVFRLYYNIDTISLDMIGQKFTWLNYNEEKTFKNYVKDASSGTKFSYVDIERLRIYTQLISFYHALKGNDFGSEKENCQQALLFVAYNFADSFSRDYDSTFEEGMFFAKKALEIKNVKIQQLAFNCYGIYAIETGDLQLAYDTYYSWIKWRLVGNLEKLKIPKFESKTNKEFKDIDISNEAIIYNNMAYVCSMISESYELKSKRGKRFHEIAIKYMKKAIDLDDKNAVFYSTYGEILCDDMNKEANMLLSLEQFRNYEDKAIPIKHKVESLREISHIFVRLLSMAYWKEEEGEEEKNQCLHKIVEKNKDYFNEFWKKAKEYQKQSCEFFSENNLTASDEKREWEKWKYNFKLLDFVEKYNEYEALKELSCLLLMIDETADAIKNELQWREYVPNLYSFRNAKLDQIVDKQKEPRVIAYYSRLKTITHVFDELCQNSITEAPHIKEKDDEKAGRISKNCLTLMHAKYMNDPYEGLKLLNVFADEIDNQVKSNIDNNLLGHTERRVLQNVIWPDSTENFREEIYDDYFVFLKSFTQQVDNLIMWNRYASDYSNGGKDSNGGLVELDEKTFSNIVYGNKAVVNRTEKKEDIPEDNYNLYRVVYISKSGEIKEEKNKGLSPNIKTYYSALKRMISELNEYLCRQDIREILTEDWDEYIEIVRRSLQQSLRFIIFLFKEDVYADEMESRMVFTKSSNEQNMIRVFDGTPEKLGINPFFQIYIKKIILGPNVRNAEVWKPYFQYHLNKMWEKNEKSQDNKIDRNEELQDNIIEEVKPYEIKSSETHYRTYGDYE